MEVHKEPKLLRGNAYIWVFLCVVLSLASVSSLWGRYDSSMALFDGEKGQIPQSIRKRIRRLQGHFIVLFPQAVKHPSVNCLSLKGTISY